MNADTANTDLVAAKRAIALAPADDKLGAIELEALRLSPMLQDDGLARGDTICALMDTATAHGLTNTRSAFPKFESYQAALSSL
jgi:hypothetical protein